VSIDELPDEVPRRPDQALVPDFASAGPRRRRRRAWPLLLAAFVLLAYVGYQVRLPYFVLGPGPAEDVLPLIHVRDHSTYQPRGHLLLTAVSFYQPNVYGVIGAWLSPSQSVVPRSDILAPGQTQQQEIRVAQSQMDTSKIDAAVVALTHYADYPSQHGQGVLVESVFDGTPAAGKLFAGDLVTQVNGQKVDSVEKVSATIRNTAIGTPIAFTVEAAGKIRQVKVAPVHVQQVSYPIIGVSLVANFPFPLTIDSGDIGGPSAGLMWTLGVIDLLTPGELTGGRVIAGTGTIALDGTVGPIGGVQEKVVAAEHARAKVFFVPAANASEARSIAHGIVLVPVKTFQDALDYLQAHP
jgi:PDZ domain-containing protein